MRYAKPALLACAISIAAVLYADAGQAECPPATQPATTQPSKLLLSKLPDSVAQEVDATDSVTPVISEGHKEPPVRVIRLTPPTEYLNWFKQQTDVGAFEDNHVEAMPSKNGVRLDHSGPGGLSASVKDAILGTLVDWGWEVTELQKESSSLNIQNECTVSGVIQVDVRPDRRFEFPFEATITCDPTQPHSGFESCVPMHATVTWKRPKSWKKDEK